ncbi:MAG: 3'-5' exonuclease [Bacteroidales bacterium]|nr:3'-5' exonuclease [Bacteroidales bacterium]
MIDIDLKNTMFIDIETVPMCADFNQMPENFQIFWDKKSANFRSEEETAADVFQRAGIYSEFGKIVCISVGFINGDKFRVKSFCGDDEKTLLTDFSNMLNNWDPFGNKTLCGHNIKEFDVPYIARRMLVNRLPLPKSIDLSGKKPWEIKHLDTLEMWKFGDYKNFTSLALLTALFDIPTPKDDIDGSQVADVYYKERDVERISVYCEKDVLAVANLVLRLQGKDIYSADQMERV